MPILNCRDCGADIDSQARVTRCKECGTLFPFVCAVCSKSLRPPFPVFPGERYLSAANEPLCPDHFERQCPECSKWFRADENPGFFICSSCSAIQDRIKTGVEDEAPEAPARAQASPNLVLICTIGVVVLIVLVVLIKVVLGH